MKKCGDRALLALSTNRGERQPLTDTVILTLLEVCWSFSIDPDTHPLDPQAASVSDDPSAIRKAISCSRRHHMPLTRAPPASPGPPTFHLANKHCTGSMANQRPDCLPAGKG